MKRLVTLIATLTAVAASAIAFAAPDKTVQLSAASPEFKWDGVQGQYSHFSLSPIIAHDPNNCSQDADSFCEQYLLDIRSDTPVQLDATLTEFSDSTADFDLYVYKSDASGKPGEEVDCGEDTGGSAGADEICKATELPGGYYLLTAVHFFNPDATYKGMAKITGATGGGGAPTPPPSSGGGNPTPPPSTGTPPSTPPPAAGGFTALPFKAAGSLGSAKKAKKKKAFTFKATAQADISNLVVALLDKKKKAVGTAKVALFKKGTKKIKLKVRKPKAGKYTLAAQGTVDGKELKTSRVVKVKK